MKLVLKWFRRLFCRKAEPRSAHEMWQLLKALGAPESCIEFRLIARVDDLVRAEAVYYPSLDLDEKGELQTAIKRYVLTEEEGDAQR